MPQHLYPGLGLDLRYHDEKEARGERGIYPLGIHQDCAGSKSYLITVREVAMMIIMDRLMDKPDWERKVFDDEITAKWTAEALALPVNPMYDEIARGKTNMPGEAERIKAPKVLLDQACLDYCIKELRTKAEFYKSSKLIPTLDACAMAVKSDTLIPQDLRDSLRAAFSRLMEDHKANPDWHPGTNEMVQDLVHPSLFPLVYGRTRVFRDEVVGVADAVDKWAGKGDVIEKPPPPSAVQNRFIGGSRLNPSYWSQNYQWLPANVAFVEGGGVKFTSYINNLHPVKYSGVYGTIEKLIETALPAWDLCLSKYAEDERAGAGLLEPRFPYPDNPNDENAENWDPSSPDDVPPLEGPDDREYKPWEDPNILRWEELREPVQPAPPEYEAADYTVPPGETLREQFADRGLQVIVKMASVELTPEKPEFPAGGWHVEGQMNEHIVGTAIYYLDSENVTPSRLAFRMQTDMDESEEWRVGQDQYGWMERIYGTGLGGQWAPCLQNYGSVETREGRLLAFPNVFHHRVSPFELADRTKPGHRRIIVLWLVDPYTRVVSTANVPPQQQEWWLESIFSKAGGASDMPPELASLILEKAGSGSVDPERAFGRLGEGKLPPELMEMVRNELGEDALPMSLEEAKGHREKLMAERSASEETVREGWQDAMYNFCEH